MSVRCKECGLMYVSEEDARYCARMDVDPRKEHRLMKREGRLFQPTLPMVAHPDRPGVWVRQTS